MSSAHQFLIALGIYMQLLQTVLVEMSVFLAVAICYVYIVGDGSAVVYILSLLVLLLYYVS